MSLKFTFKNLNYKLIYLLFSFLLFILVSGLIFNNLIYFYINPIINETTNDISRFGDWTVIVDAISCSKKGFNIYVLNPCDVSNRPHVYGNIFLYLPFVDKFYNFYILGFPLFLNFLVITAITFHLKPKNLFNYLLLSLLILTTPVLLSLERGNSELIIFLLLILIAQNRNYFIVHSIISLIASLKFFPIVTSIIFLCEKIKFKKYLNISISFFIFVFIVYINFDGLSYIYKTKASIMPSTVENVGMYIFSFQGMPQLVKSTVLHLNIFDAELTLAIAQFILGFLVLFLIILNFNFINKGKIFYKFDLNLYEERLFLLSCVLLTIIFFFPNMSYLYREIYFLGLIPFLRKNYNYRNPYLKFFYILIIFKFIVFTFLWISQTLFFETSIFVKGFNIFFKNLIDNILIIILSSFLLLFLRQNFFADFKKIK